MLKQSKQTTKTATMMRLMSRAGGASIDQLIDATGWQSHSIRAALTGLRKKGHDVQRSQGAKGRTVYRLVKGA